LAWINQTRSWLHNLATRFSPVVIPAAVSSSAMNQYPNVGSPAWMSRAASVPGHVDRDDALGAAEALRSTEPAAAAALEAPWRIAVRVRARLRSLGPGAEEVAVRLLPTWRLPLEQLPSVAAALTPASGGSTRRPHRTGPGRAVASTSVALAQ
jgi:hypothetical protein